MDFIDNIILNIDKVQALLAALVAIVLAGIAAYKTIKKAIEDANRLRLENETIPLIAEAEVAATNLANSLAIKPEVNPLSNEGKNHIVVQALKERQPKLLKKMKLRDFLDVGLFVDGLYQRVKPIIKALKH